MMHGSGRRSLINAEQINYLCIYVLCISPWKVTN